MTQIKQRTIEDATGASVTFSLHKLRNPIPEIRDTPNLYEIRINGSTDEELFTRREADRAFSRAIEDHKRGAQLDAIDRSSTQQGPPPLGGDPTGGSIGDPFGRNPW